MLQIDDGKIIKSKTEYYCTNCAEKVQRIKELEKENENKSELGLALYTALAKQLEEQGMIDNIPSAIDQLVGKTCGKYADMYSEYKSQQKELALYKKAFELAYYRGDEFICEEDVLKKAKEEIDEQKASKKERKD